MLERRPNCECCDKDLPPDSPEAFYLLVRVYFLPGPHDGAAGRLLLWPVQTVRPQVAPWHQPVSFFAVHKRENILANCHYHRLSAYRHTSLPTEASCSGRQ